jgi:hypothetical protein
MKSPIQLLRITIMLVVGFLGVADFTGCESIQDTSFVPLDCKLEPIPGESAQYIVLINTSGQTLHDIRFWGDMWYDQAMTYNYNDQIPVRRPAIIYSFSGSNGQWDPGQVVRIRRNLSPISGEASILYPVSRVQIAGTCDEGPFREDWQINGAGQLQPMGVNPHK